LTQQNYPFPPPPYTPPMVDPRAWGTPLPNAPGRSAAIWQFIVGGIIFLLGTCIGGTMLVAPDDLISQMLAQQHNQLPVADPVHAMRLAFLFFSGVMLLLGTLLFVLAFSVRRGGRRAIVASISISMIIGLFALMDLVLNAAQAAGNPTILLGLPLIVGFLALCIVTIVKLFGALNASGAAQTQAMQQAYYWMMQYQQNSGQGGYGYGQPQPPVSQLPAQSAPPPPPPPPQIPPPAPPSDQV
jgi:hypothetical protein